MALIKDKAKYIEAAHTAEDKYGIPRNTLVGLLGAESNWNPNAVSSAGARGIAQFMKGTAKEYGIDPLDPYQSIDAAGKYLANSYKKFGNWEDSLRSYNLGVGGVQQWKAGKRTLPKETQDYVGRVYKKAGIKYEEPTYANSVAPYVNQTVLPTLIDFEVSQQNTNLASVPETEQTQEEEPEEVISAKEELQQKQNEENFIADLYANAQQEEAPQPVQLVQPQQTNVLEKYAQIESFVDSPTALQQGGEVKRTFNFTPEGLGDFGYTTSGDFSATIGVGVLPEDRYSRAGVSYDKGNFHTSGDYRRDNIGNTFSGQGSYTTPQGSITASYNKNPEEGYNFDYAIRGNVGNFSGGLNAGVNNEGVTQGIDLSYNNKGINAYANYKNSNYIPSLRAGLGYNKDGLNLALGYDYDQEAGSNFNASARYSFQQGGIIKDQEGQRKYPNQITEIQGNVMSTSGYGNIPLYVIPDKGNPQIIEPNTGEYIFKEATKFTEFPITNQEKSFLKEMQKYKRQA